MILDTNAYSALAIGDPTILTATSLAVDLKVPLPVVAELRYGFAKGARSDRNENILQRFLAQPQVSVLAPTLATTEQYAQLQLTVVQKGRLLSQNDLWIAALALESGDTLVTFDQDFTVLMPLMNDLLLLLKHE